VAIGKPEKAPGRGFLGYFSQLVSDFKEASRKFLLEFLHKKTSKSQRSFTKYCFDF
jgi:hypothetical protein